MRSRRRPASRARAMQQVDLEGARDVVGAVAVGRVGSSPDGVLHDPEVAGQGVEVDAG